MRRMVLLALLGCAPVVYGQGLPAGVGGAAAVAPSGAPGFTPERIDALMAGDAKDAVAAMAPAFRADKSDAYMDEALAVAYMRLGQFQPARAPMDAAYAATKKPSRALVLNRAMLDTALRTTAPRAVKDLSAYLAGHMEVDELAVNVLGTAIARAAGSTRSFRSSAIFASAVRTYGARNADLESAAAKDTPGMKHWGTQWLTPQQYADLQAREQAAAQDRQAKLSEFEGAQADAAAAETAAREQQVDNQYLQDQLRQSAVIVHQQRQVYRQQQQAATAGPGASTRPAAGAAVPGAAVPVAVNVPAVVQPNLVYDPSTGQYTDSRFPIPPGAYEAALAAQQNSIQADSRLARARAALSQAGPAVPQPQWLNHFDPVWPPEQGQ